MIRELAGWALAHYRSWMGQAWPQERVKRGGIRWRLNPRDEEISRMIWLAGRWDYRYLNLLAGNLTDGWGVFVDVGAHIGATTIPLAKRFPGVKFWCFEPDPTSHELLEENVSRNLPTGQVALSKMALGEKPGIFPFFTHGSNTGKNSLEAWGDCRAEFDVLVGRLDDYPVPFKERVRFLKVDVQGHELHVLRGAKRLLGRDRPVLHVEYHPRYWGGLDGVVELESYGYRVAGAYKYGARRVDFRGLRKDEEADLLCYPTG